MRLIFKLVTLSKEVYHFPTGMIIRDKIFKDLFVPSY